MAMQRFLLLSLWVFSVLVSALPKPDLTAFKNLPDRIFYFEDTSVVLYHDPTARIVYISDNEGKSWKPAPGVPSGEAVGFIEHPFDNRIAFILTKGKKHYKTMDRGKLWQSFDVPADLSLNPRPLSFHAGKKDYILYQGRVCKSTLPWSKTCEDETFYTLNGFQTSDSLLKQTSQCSWAHSTKDIPATTNPNLTFCVAFDKSNTGGFYSISSSRLFSSDDFFDKNQQIVDFGQLNPKASRGVVGLGVVSKFLIAAVKDVTGDPSGVNSEMNLYVSLDGHTWGHAKFPHASTSKLFENAYTIVESTTHSLAVDVLNHPSSAVGTLFVSNSNGTFFTQSLQNTNRNEFGYVDFENIYGVEGVGLANIVTNVEEMEHSPRAKKIKSMITFDDGRSWSSIQPPTHDESGNPIPCSSKECGLHLYSVSTPHNLGRVFSTPAPGFVLGVGSVGSHLAPYDECDTFLSTDAGVTWKMVKRGAHKYEIGDKGSIMVLADDEEPTDFVWYSWNDGKDWEKYNLGAKLRVRLLTTIPDSTSQKFILLGTLSRQDPNIGQGRHAIVFLDFALMKKRKCSQDDMEKWMARTAKGKECLMGHKQWYWRRKADVDCYVGDKFRDPEEHEENCPCEEEDYECDYNYVLQNGKCVAVGPEPIGPGVCKGESPNEKYLGSSGYRLIPGNTCTREGGVILDKQVEKDCSQAQPPEGNVTHQTFQFPSRITGHWWFRNSQARHLEDTILVHLEDGEVWQSVNEGYSWAQPRPGEKILAVYHHAYSNDRAYLIGKDKMFLTTDRGRMWTELSLPLPPNIFRLSIIHTHPDQSDWLIYIGSENCETTIGDCKAVAFYSTDHARHWKRFETYVVKCGWARDHKLKLDKELILCESFRDKKGSQKNFGFMNPLQLWAGQNFYRKKTLLFDRVVGYAKFSEYLLVGEVGSNALDLQVSLDGLHYSKGLFPPSMRLDNHAYTVLESSTKSVFLHLTTSDKDGAEWGNLLKSNSNGTYYGLSLENANRNRAGYVDFEKMIGLDGIAVMNIVANPNEAAVTRKKKLQTRITHNDGGTWKPMTPPPLDSLGQPYKCSKVGCSLHIHGYTERIDARATYSSPSAIGLMIAVGNVGEHLVDYKDSDTFLTRDGGFQWEEIHKDAHMFEFGDSGSVLVLVNDEGPTDKVLYSTNEGTSWKEYQFGDSIRAASIVTMTAETNRKFILFGHTSAGKSVAVHLDFSSITSRQCALKLEDPAHDDFELWSPSEEREEQCLFGRQTLYRRRLRDRDCSVGDQVQNLQKIVKNCQCIETDFECEFNHIRNSTGQCVLAEGAAPLPPNLEEMCLEDPDLDYWHERTAYRKIPYSTCQDGARPDWGPAHSCGGVRGRSGMFWLSIFLLPFAITGVVTYYYYRQGGYRRGAIRLPDSMRDDDSEESGVLSTIASIPWFVMGLAATAWSAIANSPIWYSVFPRQRGYRHVPVDEDARVLRFDDEE
ncbi:Oligoxyloglucan reducing end-specific cellobiohydrolase [Cantharellus anzutake]|uniref:Oligoxyloglucan reducing end-specific cellobiohydrolase n=1 Tax=Cantharellus anzutake TaxID=1750568 RepID=UPI001902D409|nr:Oligoxyloglucan reducing end-specific cellobiohydrolase [Cantharellus anzutake]KAF8325469.1 Oligoxyloglucan reducing end-specific cellobiohydrolase [Cantharellus anzutake]